MNFGNFAGNEKLKARLSKMADTGNVPQAIIFEGKRGLGKRTLALRFANALLCENPDDKPCGICRACIKMSDGAHPDVVVIDGRDSKNISVDEMRNVRSDAFVKPNEGKYKIYVILDADEMRAEAQNAVLKILEEPPSYCVFIMTCENRSGFLPTVLSRAVTLELFPLSFDEAFNAVSDALPNENAESIKKAVTVFSGNVGEAISSLSNGGFSKLYDVAADIMGAVCAPNEMELLQKSAVFENDKELFKNCISLMELIVRDVCVQRSGSSNFISGIDKNNFGSWYSLTERQLLQIKSELDAIRVSLGRSPNHTLLITRFCARLRQAAGR